MSGPSLYFEDFVPGEVATFGPVTITGEDIVAFAREWDPQPMHVDEAAARGSLLGGLAASGWHTCCILMRLICDGYLLDAASMGGPGVEEVRWIRPVRPGDSLSVRREVLETRIMRSRPGVGVVRWRFEMSNQDAELVMTAVFPGFLRLRAAEGGR
jgi:acyl dehydratase